MGKTGFWRRHAPKLALASAAVDFSFFAAKLGLALYTGSLSLLGEAVHSALDMGASGLSWAAVRAAGRPADRDHPFGHGKLENLAAYTEGMLLAGLAATLLWAGIERLLHPHPVHLSAVAFGFLLLALFLEVGRAVVLGVAGQRAQSAALAANAFNRLADIWSLLAVLAGLGLNAIGFARGDALAAIAVAGILALLASRVLWTAANALTDRGDPVAEAKVAAAILSVSGVQELRELRLRRSGPDLIGEASVIGVGRLSLPAAGELKQRVLGELEQGFPELQLTLRVELAGAGEDLQRVWELALAEPGFHDIHELSLEQEAGGGLHLSLHAQLPGDMGLREASARCQRLEERLREGMPELRRVDIHLEPYRERVVEGVDVTERRTELKERIEAVVAGQKGIGCCQEVEISQRPDGLVVHIVAEPQGPLDVDGAHRLETLLEDSVRRRVAGLSNVIARLQPAADQ